MKIKTLPEARRFVKQVRICSLFSDKSGNLPSLWDVVDLPDRRPGERGWGEKIGAVWNWKNRLPAEYPDEIFYGKIKGGAAVLMTLDYLRDVHYTEAHRELRDCRRLARQIYEVVRTDLLDTTALRKESIARFNCTKSRFDSALKELQITLNIVRSNDPDVERDTWVRFQEIYPEIYDHHHSESRGLS